MIVRPVTSETLREDDDRDGQENRADRASHQAVARR
jgi:hypothetical protein